MTLTALCHRHARDITSITWFTHGEALVYLDSTGSIYCWSLDENAPLLMKENLESEPFFFKGIDFGCVAVHKKGVVLCSANRNLSASQFRSFREERDRSIPIVRGLALFDGVETLLETQKSGELILRSLRLEPSRGKQDSLPSVRCSLPFEDSVTCIEQGLMDGDIFVGVTGGRIHQLHHSKQKQTMMIHRTFNLPMETSISRSIRYTPTEILVVDEGPGLAVFSYASGSLLKFLPSRSSFKTIDIDSRGLRVFLLSKTFNLP